MLVRMVMAMVMITKNEWFVGCFLRSGGEGDIEEHKYYVLSFQFYLRHNLCIIKNPYTKHTYRHSLEYMHNSTH